MYFKIIDDSTISTRYRFRYLKDFTLTLNNPLLNNYMFFNYMRKFNTTYF